jgi:hypothetical protein
MAATVDGTADRSHDLTGHRQPAPRWRTVGPSATEPEVPMTALTVPTPVDTAPRTVSGLRILLLVDGLGTALLGVGALAAASPLSDHVGSPAALRVVGVLFLVLGADMLLTRRLSGRRLTAAVTGLAAFDLVWAAGTTAALPLLSTTATGTTLVLGVTAVCVAMGTAKLLLARQLRG